MKRVVRLADLSADERRLVLALIDAARAAQPEAVPTSPRKRGGTASSKEKVTG